METNPVLAVVIPLFNEEKNIPDLIRDWKLAFEQTGVPYRIILIDDGSKDNSLPLLRAMQEEDSGITVHSQPNAGHGSAILKGYGMALTAEWIFQIDSDHQLDTTAFGELWENRSHYDLLLAERKERNASFPRRCVSLISGRTVDILYGGQVKDVNSPYRLMRSVQLREILEKIPPESFAPNILLTSWFVLKKKRIFTTVAYPRKTAVFRQSKMNLNFLLGSLYSAWQTVLFRIKR